MVSEEVNDYKKLMFKKFGRKRGKRVEGDAVECQSIHTIICKLFECRQCVKNIETSGLV